MHKGAFDLIWAKGLSKTVYKSVSWTQSVTFVSNLHFLLNKAHVSQAVMIILSALLLHVAERNMERIPKLRQCIRGEQMCLSFCGFTCILAVLFI